jgi:hypothetical protein
LPATSAMSAMSKRWLRRGGLLADATLWRRTSAAARNAALRFRVESIVPMYESYYEEVLARDALTPMAASAPEDAPR